MSNKLKGMIWLRGQVTLANKSILLQVSCQFSSFFSINLFFSLNGAGKEIGADKLATMLLTISLPFSLAMSVGTPIIIILAEEREKHNLQSFALGWCDSWSIYSLRFNLASDYWNFFISSLPQFFVGAKLSNHLFSYSFGSPIDHAGLNFLLFNGWSVL